MNFLQTSDRPFTAVADIPPSQTVPKTTPAWNSLKIPLQWNESDFDLEGKVTRRKLRYLLPSISPKRSSGLSTSTTSATYYPSHYWTLSSFGVLPLPLMRMAATPNNLDEVQRTKVDEGIQSDQLAFYCPVILLLSLVMIAGIVMYCMRRRKKLDDLRHRLVPVYRFAPGEEEEWGVLLNREEVEHPETKDPSKHAN